jgi:uncharacterized membrane protein
MTRLYCTLTIAVAALTLAASAAIYPWLTDKIPTHWNIHGQIDGYGSKQWAAFLLPCFMLGLTGLFAALPSLSPKEFELDTFRATYWFICLMVVVMLGYIHALTLCSALAGGFDITRALLAGVLLMFGLMGGALTRVKRNFWVGVRTPWTIASDRVWTDTHRLAARLFVIAAALGLFVLLLPLPIPALIFGVLGLIFAAAIGPAIYSLIHYKQLQSRGEI